MNLRNNTKSKKIVGSYKVYVIFIISETSNIKYYLGIFMQ